MNLGAIGLPTLLTVCVASHALGAIHVNICVGKSSSQVQYPCYVNMVAVVLPTLATVRVARHALGAIQASVSGGKNSSLVQYPWFVNMGAVDLPTLATVRVARPALGVIQVSVSGGKNTSLEHCPLSVNLGAVDLPSFPTARVAWRAPGVPPANVFSGNDSSKSRMAMSWGGYRGGPIRGLSCSCARWKPGNVCALVHTEVVSLLPVCVGVLQRCDVLPFRVIDLVNALSSTMCQNKVLTSNCSHMYIVRLIHRLGAEAPCF